MPSGDSPDGETFLGRFRRRLDSAAAFCGKVSTSLAGSAPPAYRRNLSAGRDGEAFGKKVSPLLVVTSIRPTAKPFRIAVHMFRRHWDGAHEKQCAVVKRFRRYWWSKLSTPRRNLLKRFRRGSHPLTVETFCSGAHGETFPLLLRATAGTAKPFARGGSGDGRHGETFSGI